MQTIFQRYDNDIQSVIYLYRGINIYKQPFIEVIKNVPIIILIKSYDSFTIDTTSHFGKLLNQMSQAMTTIFFKLKIKILNSSY